MNEQDATPAIGLAYGVESKKLVNAAEVSDQRRRSRLLGRINRDAIYLSVILVLCLLLIVLAGFVVSSLTSVNVNVLFESPASASNQADDTAENTDTTDETGDQSLVAPDTETTVYFVALKSSNPNFDFATLTEALPTESGDYLVPVNVRAVADTEQQQIEEILQALFAQQDFVYRGASLTNKAFFPNLTFQVIDNLGSWQVDLTGDFSQLSAGEVVLFKEQLERSIGVVTATFFISINGEELNYDRLGI